jgi:hypothetical protein
MSWEDVTEQLDRYLREDDRITPGTGINIPAATEPLPELYPGVPLYDAVVAWITRSWGGYAQMPLVGRNRWWHLLAVSRGRPGDKYRELRRLAEWLLEEWRSAPPPAGSGSAEGAGEDLSAYRPATEFLDSTRFRTYNQLHAALKRQPWIRTRKPSPQRLLIHAGDWHHYLTMLDDAGFDALDVQAQTVDVFLAEVRRRQEEIRARKAGE